ncbi:peptidase of plants and bacteria-domain-containing protein [Blastocladiella britannica]|nr:peptidase of plants and bacteria-domain-containing protein [Blastocladiella britannica]
MAPVPPHNDHPAAAEELVLILARLAALSSPTTIPRAPSFSVSIPGWDHPQMVNLFARVPDVAGALGASVRFVYAALYGTLSDDLPVAMTAAAAAAPFPAPTRTTTTDQSFAPHRPTATVMPDASGNYPPEYQDQDYQQPQPWHRPGARVPVLKESISIHFHDFEGIAYTTNPSPTTAELHVSTQWLKGMATHATDPAGDQEYVRGVMGVFVHEAVHMYQGNGHGHAPGGLVEGVADWVRLRSGLVPRHWRRRIDCNWDAGYDATAYFLEAIDRRVCAAFPQKLNATLVGTRWSEQLFADVTGGIPLAVLWDMYCEDVRAGISA